MVRTRFKDYSSPVQQAQIQNTYSLRSNSSLKSTKMSTLVSRAMKSAPKSSNKKTRSYSKKSSSDKAQKPLQTVSTPKETTSTTSTSTRPKFGKKYLNLAKVQKALQNTSVKIPEYIGFDDPTVKSLLSKKTLQTWDLFASKAKKQENIFELSDEAEKLQEMVENDILRATLPFTEKQNKFLLDHAGKELIIRSASNEDEINTPTAGGNKSIGSVKAFKAEVQKALAKVVASYFSIESFNIRSSTSQAFQELPICSAIVMEQIVDDTTCQIPFTSGVMMSHKESWCPEREEQIHHISATYGFGEAVVNAKLPCDEWVVTDDSIYPTIRNKPERYVTSADGTLRLKKNKYVDQKHPSIGDTSIKLLQDIAKNIEREFQMPINIEFVIKANQIYIVQAREIQHKQKPESAKYLDIDSIPQGVNTYTSEPIVIAGLSAFNLTFGEIVFAETLKEAERAFKPGKTKLVLVEKFESSETHPAINFASQKPPIPCYAIDTSIVSIIDLDLNLECFSEIQAAQSKPYIFCPQTGMLIQTDKQVDLKEGLFQHPAKFPISIYGEEESYQSQSHDQRIENVLKLLSNTPKTIAKNIGQIEALLKELISEIKIRDFQTPEMSQALTKLKEAIFKELAIIKERANSHKFTSLAFHTTILKQLLAQQNSSVGAHSLSGIERATNIPENIKVFMQKHNDSLPLQNLALLGKDAFDTPLQTKWLSFLENHAQANVNLLHKLQMQLDSFKKSGLLSQWFLINFSVSDPSIEQLIQKNSELEDHLQKFLEFNTFISCNRDSLSSIDSADRLSHSWDNLKKITENYFTYFLEHKELLSSSDTKFYISKLTIDLIRLWDLNIKKTITAPYFTNQAAYASKVEKCLNEFKKFGLSAIQAGIIPSRFKADLKTLFKTMDQASNSVSNFSVINWLIPLSIHLPSADDYNKKLTILHQNYEQLVTSGADLKEIARFLPKKIASAYEMFSLKGGKEAKRFKESASEHISFDDNSISVRFNIPMNFHSATVTLKQTKGLDDIDILINLRGSDNHQKREFPFIKAFSIVTGIPLLDYNSPAADLNVRFSAKNEKQLQLIFGLFNFIHHDSLNFNSNKLYYLAHLIAPKSAFDPETNMLPNEAFAEIKDSILKKVYEHFTVTGKIFLPELKYNRFFSSNTENNQLFNYIKENNLLPEVISHFKEELKDDTSSHKPYIKEFTPLVFEALEAEEAISLIVDDARNRQNIDLTYISNKALKSLPQLKQLLLDDLNDQTPGNEHKVAEYLAKVILEKMVEKDEAIQIIQADLDNANIIPFDVIPYSLKEALLIPFLKNQPDKALEYAKKNPSFCNEIEFWADYPENGIKELEVYKKIQELKD